MSKNYAVLNENNEVINIIIANDDFTTAENYIEYVETNPAYIGGYYHDNYFYAPQPFPSWSRDGLGNWQAPNSAPTDGQMYRWVEEDLNWQLIEGV